MLQKFIDRLMISNPDDDSVPNEHILAVETKLAALRELQQVVEERLKLFAFLLLQNDTFIKYIVCPN